MKKILRLTAALLLLALVLCMAVACREPEEETIPDGMMSANRPGDDFRFYVPTNWNLNTAYGVSGAYYYIDNISTVSVVKYPITETVANALPAGGDADQNAARMDQYHALYCMPVIRSQATGEVASYGNDAPDALLGTAAARRYHLLAKVGESNVHFLQVVTEKNNAFYVFTFSAIADLYDMLLGDVERMLSTFLFSDTPYDPDTAPVEIPADEQAPAGMQRACRKGLGYRFYIPASWKAETSHDVSGAYVEGKSVHVSVVPYVPTQVSMSVEDYFKSNRAEMERVGGENSFVLVSEKEVTLSGRAARMYEYTWTLGGTTYCYRQVIGAWRSSFYNLTYTALAGDYEAYLSDFDAIISAFAFE